MGGCISSGKRIRYVENVSYTNNTNNTNRYQRQCYDKKCPHCCPAYSIEIKTLLSPQ